MATRYSQIQKKIDALTAKADTLRLREAKGVIARIKEAIAHYGLTMTDLFGGKSASSGRGATSAAKRGAQAKARFSDGQGNVWGGRGPRPEWLREALANGGRLEEFDTQGATTVRPSSRKATRKKSRKGTVRYSDGAGNTWTGVGRKPRWFSEALAAGKKPEDMAAS